MSPAVSYSTMNDHEIPTSRIALYWLIWIGTVLLVLFVRFTVMRNVGEETVFALCLSYMLPTWLAIMDLNFTEGYRLVQYLKDNHYEKWKEITYVPGLGYGCCNSYRSLPFVYSKDDLGDPVVTSLKKNYRAFVRLALTVFFTFPLIFIAVMLPCVN